MKIEVEVDTLAQLEEALAVELAARPLEAWILHDTPRDLGIGDAEAKRPHALVEQHLAEDLLRELPVDAKLARLLERDRAPELTAERLQLVRIKRAELLDGDLGLPDLGERRAAKAAEDVADPPDCEADHQHRDHGPHDGFADPA